MTRVLLIIFMVAIGAKCAIAVSNVADVRASRVAAVMAEVEK